MFHNKVLMVSEKERSNERVNAPKHVKEELDKFMTENKLGNVSTR